MTEEEKLKVRIARTRKLLAAMQGRFCHDFGDVSELLEICIEILDGKRDDEGQNDASQ